MMLINRILDNVSEMIIESKLCKSYNARELTGVYIKRNRDLCHDFVSHIRTALSDPVIVPRDYVILRRTVHE